MLIFQTIKHYPFHRYFTIVILVYLDFEAFMAKLWQKKWGLTADF
jgi:hypothetical protein